MILCIETATPVCSVCLSDKGVIQATRESRAEKAHATSLTPFVEEVLAEAGISAASLDMVAVSMGPGSYTGLRIGVSVAKGLAWGAGVPMTGIPSLKALANGFLSNASYHENLNDDPGKHLIVPMIDARRMEVFSAIFDRKLHEIQNTHALVVEPHSFDSYTPDMKLFFIGDGALKCREVVKHPGAVFPEKFHASACHMVKLAEAAFNNKEFVDLAYFEPFYLKDFIPTIPRKNIFHPPDHQA